MRIRRSSSKKNKSDKPKFFSSAEADNEKNKSLRIAHSNDSRDNHAYGLTNIKSSEHVNKAENLNAGKQSSHPTKYQNLSAKIETTQKDESTAWDKRFIDFTNKARCLELLPKPDASVLKKILDSEKDER